VSDGWITCTCTVPETDVAAVEAVFENAGAQALTCTAAADTALLVDELDGRTPLWPVCDVTGLFDPATMPAEPERLFSDAGLTVLNVRTGELDEQQWQSVWRDHFEPRLFGGRLCICPSWREPLAGSERVIRIDPGMAFGTGNHATTALCLEWIACDSKIAGSRVLDYGCGSGILALAAAARGAVSVHACDIDAQAMSVCRHNIALNAFTAVAVVPMSEIDTGAYDLIVANILLEPLTALVARFHALLAPGGRIVLSGILAAQAPDLLAAYAGAFTMEPSVQCEEWALIAGTRAAGGPKIPTRNTTC
jgi:ribosomal protein L11 methyltransferase